VPHVPAVLTSDSLHRPSLLLPLIAARACRRAEKALSAVITTVTGGSVSASPGKRQSRQYLKQGLPFLAVFSLS